MANTATPKRHAIRSLVGLLIVVLLGFGLNSIGVFTASGDSFGEKFAEGGLPKLGLDLQGGTQVILQARTTSNQPPSTEQLNQSIAIIRQRVTAAGSPDAQISASGGQNVVVSLPGRPSRATIESVRASARLDFRPVLTTSAATSASIDEKGTTPKAYTPAPSLATTPTAKPTDASDLAQVTPYLADLYENYQCSQGKDNGTANPKKPLVTCDTSGTAKFILGPVEVPGTNISDATSGLGQSSSGATNGQWVINLEFNGVGTQQFSKISSRLVNLEGAQNQFGIVLDGQVLSAPAMNAAITNGKAQISGNFTQDSAKALAQQLKFGALPVNFTVQSQQTISATLGSSQLTAGLIAGLIGLLLVFLYALYQYRLLGLAILASLGIAAVFTYIVLDYLSWRQGYRISLAGVTGVIVSIGITADSFIVYFERVRDELREGKKLAGAVESGWRRARRTVLASDGVNLLAALTLFALAVGDVRGFALTLGLATLIDVLVVFLFTHPLLQLLATRPFFASGHKLSGMDPRELGAVYRGRGQFRIPTGASRRGGNEVAHRQTIAERKVAEAADQITRKGA